MTKRKLAVSIQPVIHDFLGVDYVRCILLLQTREIVRFETWKPQRENKGAYKMYGGCIFNNGIGNLSV